MKLDDLNKRNIYKVPNDYFDELPGKIQNKIQAQEKRSVFQWPYLLRWTTPLAAVLLVLAIFIFRTPNQTGAQLSYNELLEEVQTEELISYLELTDVSSEEILSEVDLETFEEWEVSDDELIIDEEISEDELDALIDEYNEDV